MESQIELFVKIAIDAWNGQLARTNELINTLTADQLQQQVAPGRNSGIYLLGHLTAVHDGLFPLLGFGQKLYPEMENIFIKNPDNAGLTKPSLDELTSAWKAVDLKLSKDMAGLTAEEWTQRHTAVTEEDSADRAHRRIAGRDRHRCGEHGIEIAVVPRPTMKSEHRRNSRSPGSAEEATAGKRLQHRYTLPIASPPVERWEPAPAPWELGANERLSTPREPTVLPPGGPPEQAEAHRAPEPEGKTVNADQGGRHQEATSGAGPVLLNRALAALTDEQRLSVDSPAEALCIVAGAGSGKTRVLTLRAARRIADGSAEADHTAIFTFTRKAAHELRQRLVDYGVPVSSPTAHGIPSPGVRAGTLHQLALALIRRHALDVGHRPRSWPNVASE